PGRHPALHSFPTRRSSDLVTNQGVFRTTDASHWTDISGNLPTLVAKGGLTKLFSILQLDNGTQTANDDTILVGGYGGVYVANPGDRKSTRLNSSHLGISYA